MSLENSRVSIISQNDIRYEGKLHKIEKEDKIIFLKDVRSFGTEDRRKDDPVPPCQTIYNLIRFKGSDIKDIKVLAEPEPTSSIPTTANQLTQGIQNPQTNSTSHTTTQSQISTSTPDTKKEIPSNKEGALAETKISDPKANTLTQEKKESTVIEKSLPQPQEEEKRQYPGHYEDPQRGEKYSQNKNYYRNNYTNNNNNNYNYQHDNPQPYSKHNNYKPQNKYYNNHGNGNRNFRPNNQRGGGNAYQSNTQNRPHTSYHGHQQYSENPYPKQNDATGTFKFDYDYSKTNEEFEKEKKNAHLNDEKEGTYYNKNDFFDNLNEDNEEFDPSRNQRSLNQETFGQRFYTNLRGNNYGHYRGRGRNYHHSTSGGAGQKISNNPPPNIYKHHYNNNNNNNYRYNDRNRDQEPEQECEYVKKY